MRGFSMASATVTWPDGGVDLKAVVAVRGGVLVVRSSGKGLTERPVRDYVMHGERRVTVTLADGSTVEVRRDGGCGCRK